MCLSYTPPTSWRWTGPVRPLHHGILPKWRTGHDSVPSTNARQLTLPRCQHVPCKLNACNVMIYLADTWQRTVQKAPNVVDFTPRIVDSRLQNDDLKLPNEAPGSSKRRYEASTRRLEASTRRFPASRLRPAVCETLIRRFKTSIRSFKRSIRRFKTVPKWRKTAATMDPHRPSGIVPNTPQT